MTKSPYSKEILNVLLELKLHQIKTQALAVTEMLSNQRSRDIDVWCVLAFLTGAQKAVNIHSNSSRNVDPALWDAFHQLGEMEGRKAAEIHNKRIVEEEAKGASK